MLQILLTGLAVYLGVLAFGNFVIGLLRLTGFALYFAVWLPLAAISLVGNDLLRLWRWSNGESMTSDKCCRRQLEYRRVLHNGVAQRQRAGNADAEHSSNIRRDA